MPSAQPNARRLFRLAALVLPSLLAASPAGASTLNPAPRALAAPCATCTTTTPASAAHRPVAPARAATGTPAHVRRSSGPVLEDDDGFIQTASPVARLCARRPLPSLAEVGRPAGRHDAVPRDLRSSSEPSRGPPFLG